jgi:predicted  nucleic acid-binding Zn-ribbon protein
MEDDKVKDMTLNVLVSIRDEIKALREDTNKRFEQMDKRFEQMDKRFERIEKDISQMRRDIGHIVARFDNDYLVLASEVDSMKKRLGTCESRLGISATQ